MKMVQLKLGERVAELTSQHNGFALVVSAALGGGKNDKPAPKVGDPGVKNLGEGHGSLEDAIAAINIGLSI